MFNAEDIIELEKQWFKYKNKQKIKLGFFLLLIIIISSFVIYTVYFPQQVHINTQNIIKKISKKPEIKKQKTKTLIKENISNIINTNAIEIPIESNTTTKEIVKLPKVIVKKDNSKPYHFKIEPTDQGSELFSSNGFLTLNLIYGDNKQNTLKENKNEVVEPIKDIQSNISKRVVREKKKSISIDMQEMDTITYLKDKYYSTSSIVFALMLAEKYYYEKKYNNALKWSLISNDIDSQNTKSWYWFAQAKVKLNQKKDAIKALEAYLSNNNSKRLSTLLHKIELGDTDD